MSVADRAQKNRTVIGRRLQEAREYLGLSKEMVQQFTGWPTNCLTRFEAGEGGLMAEELAELALLYRRPVGWFYEESLPEIGDALAGIAVKLTNQDALQVAKFSEFLKSAGPAPKPIESDEEE